MNKEKKEKVKVCADCGKKVNFPLYISNKKYLKCLLH